MINSARRLVLEDRYMINSVTDGAPSSDRIRCYASEPNTSSRLAKHIRYPMSAKHMLCLKPAFETSRETKQPESASCPLIRDAININLDMQLHQCDRARKRIGFLNNTCAHASIHKHKHTDTYTYTHAHIHTHTHTYNTDKIVVEPKTLLNR